LSCCFFRGSPAPPSPTQIKSALNKTAAVFNKTATVPGLAAKAAWLNRTAETKLAAVNATLATVAGKV
jgi:hypothetical protein